VVHQTVHSDLQVVFRRKGIAKIVSDTEQMKNTPIHVYTKTAFVYGNFNHGYNVSPVHLHALLGVGNFTKVVRLCANRL
jgi:hypothetical protein